MNPANRLLRVFVCHAAQDDSDAKKLFNFLEFQGWIAPWLDHEELLAGMDWESEIQNAMCGADVIILCFSEESVKRGGYLQKEFKLALELAEKQPAGAIFIIPLRFDVCNPPNNFGKWQWVDYFEKKHRPRLIKALEKRAEQLGITIPMKRQVVSIETSGSDIDNNDEVIQFPAKHIPDLYKFVKITEGEYPFWIAKYPVTNAQYKRFLDAPDFANAEYWVDFPEYACSGLGKYNLRENLVQNGLLWMRESLEDDNDKTSVPVIMPRYWGDNDFGITQSTKPVVGVTWFEANAYCKWLKNHWCQLDESLTNPDINLEFHVRLPLESEWGTSAGGENPRGRYPWDKSGEVTVDIKEVISRANIADSKLRQTTPVDYYAKGESSLGVMDMVGNVWEWQANLYCCETKAGIALRGGAWDVGQHLARISICLANPDSEGKSFGFRVIVVPTLQTF